MEKLEENRVKLIELEKKIVRKIKLCKIGSKATKMVKKTKLH